MASQRTPVVRVAGGTQISARIAVAAWAAAWLAGMVLSGAVVGASGHAGEDLPVWVTVLGTTAMWIPMLVVLREVSVRYGVRDVVAEYGLRFRPVDAAGLAIGSLSQLVLLPVIYWPLQELWPGTFSRDELEDRARDLYDSADGGWIVALVVMVVVGAPLVEELLYRGLLQGAFARRVESWLAVLVVAAWFALIHFAPVEYPGLFSFGLVLGTCALVTKRLGLAIVTHMAFNATGLLLVAGR